MESIQNVYCLNANDLTTRCLRLPTVQGDLYKAEATFTRSEEEFQQSTGLFRLTNYLMSLQD